jgi:hypothetical protein
MNNKNEGTRPFLGGNIRIILSLIIIYVTLVSIAIYILWKIGSYLSVLSGNKWIKYILLVIAIPIASAYLMMPTGHVFDFIFDNTPWWFWGSEAKILQ